MLLFSLEEGVGFEPTELLHSFVFKTNALNRSANPPYIWRSHWDSNPDCPKKSRIA